MPLLQRLSIQSKLMLMLLLVSIGSISVIAFQGYRSGKDALRQSIFQQLTSLRATRTQQLESYVASARAEIATLSESLMVVDAMTEFVSAFNQLSQAEVPKAWDLATERHYQEEFLSRLDAATDGTPTIDIYRPFRRTTRYLQHQYIANNPHAVGQKSSLTRTSDGSRYSQIHAQYHGLFRSLVRRFEFYDLFLIDAESGNIVYSVEKEVDFATSLREGPYAESNLATAFELAIKSDRDTVILVDFETYRPSYGQPAAFLASPVYSGGRLTGVLAVQLSIDRINRIMTSNQDWEREGLGKTGETYLVGEDRLMRSGSRRLIEDPEGYFAALSRTNLAQAELDRIRALGTSILTQRVDRALIDTALAGENGIEVSQDYQGNKALTAFAPLQINGVRWVLLADIAESEAFAPIRQFQRQVLVSAAAIVLAVTLASLLIARSFVKPLHRITEAFGNLGRGVDDVKLKSDSADEFGQLITAFNATVDSLQQKTAEVRQKNRENELLLHSVLPDTVARRLKQGEDTIADNFPNVTVLFANLSGFTDLTHELPPEQTVTLLNQIVSEFDEAGDRQGVEKIKTMGSGYMAVCGLSVAQLDHTRRTIDFAIEMGRWLRSFNHQHNLDLKLKVGIHSGEVVAGVVGRSRFVYDLWGETVNVAYRVHAQSEDNLLLVTRAVYERISDLYDFDPWIPLETSGGKVEVWGLKI